MRELCNENIDVINYTEDNYEFIKRALQPAHVQSVEIDKENRRAKVVVPADQVSKAIGKGGVNIRLATQLTNHEIDVYREVEDEDDIDIFEFADDFGDDIVQLLYDIGCDTARSVLELSPSELERRTEGRLAAKDARQIIRTIEEEFEEDEA